MNTINRKTVTIDHAAAILGVSRRTIYYRIRDGHIQTIKTNGTQRVIIESLENAPGKIPFVGRKEAIAAFLE
jgi:excisionase family DNA binding protein